MDLYARVNILNGRAVRLDRGQLERAMSLDADPLARAHGWVEKGIDYLLVVDLDAAAYGSYVNRPLIDRMLAELDVPVVVAGGVRSHVEAARLIENGAWHVVMGTAAIEDQNMVWELCRDYPGRMLVSLDVLETEELVVHGWTSHSGRFLEEVMVEMSSAGVAGFFIAHAGRDVLTEPPDFDLFEAALSYAPEPIIAAGGVRHLDDLRRLMGLERQGRTLQGVVVGREVTEGRFSVEQAQAVLSGSDTSQPHRVRQMRTVLHVADLAASTEFYERAVGCRRLSSWDEDGNAGALLEVADGRIIELLHSPDGLAPSGVELVFVVDDVDAWHDRLGGLGLQTGSLSDEAWGRSFELHDPDGVAVRIAQLVTIASSRTS